MMNMLPRLKFSSEMALHNMPVFANTNAINGNIIINSWLALSGPSHNRANLSSLFCVFWIRYGCAPSRAIHGCWYSVFRNIKRGVANKAILNSALFSFFCPFKAIFFRYTKSSTAMTAKNLLFSFVNHFTFTNRTMFNFHRSLS